MKTTELSAVDGASNMVVTLAFGVKGWRLLRFEKWTIRRGTAINTNYGIKLWRFKIFVAFV